MANYLCIPDLQVPFQKLDTIPFLKRVQKYFRIGNENIYCVGDELDFYWLSVFQKNPNIKYSAVSEIEFALEFLAELYKAFPTMRLCFSNHGKRMAKKAWESGFPDHFLKSYREVIKAPATYHWARSWVVRCKYPFMVEHGHKWGGQNGLLNAITANPFSTVFGHNHTCAGTVVREWEKPGTTVEIERRNPETIRKWGMNVGCLTERQEIAFEYGEDHKYSDVLSCGVVLDDGHVPVVVPYEK